MSCRWTLRAGLGDTDACLDAPGASAVYADLARAGRKDDFHWFARSQGVPEERLEGLWLGALTRLVRSPVPRRTIALDRAS